MSSSYSASLLELAGRIVKLLRSNLRADCMYKPTTFESLEKDFLPNYHLVKPESH